jgi:hypothetical protein
VKQTPPHHHVDEDGLALQRHDTLLLAVLGQAADEDPGIGMLNRIVAEKQQQLLDFWLRRAHRYCVVVP